ncbi:helix-turn-helix domain-containing protein [Rhizobium straminoryzae]
MAVSIDADRLANSDRSVSAVASSVGYESESAFGLAFKQTVGCSPQKY